MEKRSSLGMAEGGGGRCFTFGIGEWNGEKLTSLD